MVDAVEDVHFAVLQVREDRVEALLPATHDLGRLAASCLLERLGGRPGVPGKIDESLLKKAEDRIAEVGAAYPERVKADLEKLVGLANQSKGGFWVGMSVASGVGGIVG